MTAGTTVQRCPDREANRRPKPKSTATPPDSGGANDIELPGVNGFRLQYIKRKRHIKCIIKGENFSRPGRMSRYS
jgi:hypothetical protein